MKYIVPEEFKYFDKDSFEYVKAELDKIEIKIELLYSDLFHDRFWISDKSGFVCGTSFNGMAKRTAIIQCLNPFDYIELYKELEKI